MLKITFSTGDVANFKNSFANFLLDTKISTLSTLKVDFSSERVTLLLPPKDESLALLSSLIKEANDFQVEFLATDDMGSEPVKTEPAEQEDCSTEGVKDPFATDTAILRSYISTCQTFSVESLREKFPNLKPHTINNLLVRLVKAKAIVSIGFAEYKVINKETIKALSNTKTSQIRSYILSRQVFSPRDIRANIPNVSSNNVGNVINQLLSAQIITKTGHGRYKVNPLSQAGES